MFQTLLFFSVKIFQFLYLFYVNESKYVYILDIICLLKFFLACLYVWFFLKLYFKKINNENIGFRNQQPSDLCENINLPKVMDYG